MVWFNEIISYVKRKWWYLTLLFASTGFVVYYRNNVSIFELKEINAMNLIFILWLILLVFPLFSEMEIFGIKVKKEVEEAKKEIRDGLTELRFQVMDLKISNSAINNINIENSLPTENSLNELRERWKENDENASEFKDSDYLLDISDDTIYLFKVRLTIENSLDDLCNRGGYNEFKSRRSIIEMLKNILHAELITMKTYETIRDIINICNRGIHGEILNEKYINFVKEFFPITQKEINYAYSRLGVIKCPECQYSGYTKSRNVCPQCGYVNTGY